jgi:hypothetical protein
MSAHSDANMGQIGGSHALVVVSDRSDAPTGSAAMTETGFLAQLIACRTGIGHYRRHRREEPAIASARYRASVERCGRDAASDLRTIKVA